MDLPTIINAIGNAPAIKKNNNALKDAVRNKKRKEKEIRLRKGNSFKNSK